MTNDTQIRILSAAKELAEENQSIQGVTISLDSVAKRVGLTKPGLMYHFRTKEALMLGLVEHFARQWSDDLSSAAGCDPAEISAFDRHRTYVKSLMSSDVSRADYWIFSSAAYQPVLSEAWQEVFRPWLGLDDLDPHVRGLLTTARFAAEGAWTAEATDVFPAEDLGTILKFAIRLIDEAEALAQAGTTARADAVQGAGAHS